MGVGKLTILVVGHIREKASLKAAAQRLSGMLGLHFIQAVHRVLYYPLQRANQSSPISFIAPSSVHCMLSVRYIFTVLFRYSYV